MNRNYIKFLAAVLLFGSNGIIASYIALDSYVIVLSRMVMGSIFLLLLLMWRQQKIWTGPPRRVWGKLILAGLALGGNWLFLYESYTQIGVSLATLACYSGPVMVLLLSVPLFHERITVIKAAGMVTVIAGMLCVNGVSVQSQGVSWGLMSGILSAVCFALLVIINKKMKGVDGLEGTLCQLLIGGVMVGAVTFSMHPQIGVLSLESVLAVIVLGVINTGIGCYLYFSAMQYLPAQTVSICGYLEPFSALIFAAVFLGEILSLLQILGAVLILGGVVFAELCPLFHKKRIRFDE
ncbi:DMT family transporter [Megasphaera sueciensis]|uniref:DMT family transporter n=1 Tax=Megasphaera sueciensis TaxID=349094 RepID=UPI003CFE53AF